jgi:hypothetical protein
MGHVSSIVKGESTSSKSGVWWQEEKLPDGDILSGKYQSISHYSDGNYAKVWYVGNRFDPERTYTSAYCKKNNLGKYANSGTSSKSSGSSSSSSRSSSGSGSGIGKALGAGAIGVAKWAFTETPEEKARKEAEIAEIEAVNSIVEPMIKNLKSELKSKYPKDTKDAATMLSYITELDELVQEHSTVSRSGDDLESKASHEYETKRLEIESAYLYKLIKRLNKKTTLKDIRKRAKKYKPMGVFKAILLYLSVLAAMYILILILMEA